jgi:hypothetical protein
MSSDFANHLQTAYEGLEDDSIQITEEIAEFEEYLQFLKDRQTEIADTVSSAGEITIDQFLGTVAMRICDDESELAVNFLSEHFGASKTRARYCVSLAISDLAFDHENSYANFHGYDIEDEHWSSISEMNYLFHNGTCHYGPDESIQNLSEDLTDLLEYVDSSLPFNDKPSLLLLAGIAAGFPSPEFALSQSLPPTTPYAYDAFLEDRTRFLCLSFAIYCAQKSRVRDSFERQPAKKTDWLKATPWLLPLVDGSNNSALDLLLETVDKLGYSYIEPGEILFKNSANEDWVEPIRNTASMIANRLRKVTSRVMHYKSNEVEIILTDDGGTVFAWVGTKREGVLTSFDTEHFAVVGLPDSNQAFAAGCAISWFVDCAINITREIPMVRQKSEIVTRGYIRHRTFNELPAFSRHRSEVRRGIHNPPVAHWVAAHIRHLSGKSPNPSHVAEAPERLQVRMGRFDTWVRAHERGGRGGNLHEVFSRLSEYSMLADSLGLLDRH